LGTGGFVFLFVVDVPVPVGFVVSDEPLMLVPVPDDPLVPEEPAAPEFPVAEFPELVPVPVPFTGVPVDDPVGVTPVSSY
jgi:hypothetical protein